MTDNNEPRTPEAGDLLDLDQAFIVIAIPDNTVELDITAKIYLDHGLVYVGRHMDFQEVREAIREASDGYVPSDALFTFAPTRREKLQKLLEAVCIDDDEDDGGLTA